jgi:hypothetical protein
MARMVAAGTDIDVPGDTARVITSHREFSPTEETSPGTLGLDA